MTPVAFYKCLSEDTRLKSLMLIQAKRELCVCDLTEALQLSQPKVSRHLAELRKCGLLQDERRGKWVYYTLHPKLPAWASDVLDQTRQNNKHYIDTELARLENGQSANACD